MPYSPAFQFYPGEYLGDKNTIPMTTIENGAYCLLMWVCWEQDGLLDDIEELADIARLSVEEFEPIWMRRIKKCFVWDQKKKVFFHPRHLKEIKKQKLWKKKKSDVGKLGAAKRWEQTLSGDASAMLRHASALPKHASSSSSSSSKNKKESVYISPLPKNFSISDDMRKWAAIKVPSLDIDDELEEFCGYWWNIDNGKTKRTAVGWVQTWQGRMREVFKRQPRVKTKASANGNGYDPKKDIMHPDYEMEQSQPNFADDVGIYFAIHDDGTREKYEQMKLNWLERPSCRGLEHEIEEYERSIKFKQRFCEAE